MDSIIGTLSEVSSRIRSARSMGARDLAELQKELGESHQESRILLSYFVGTQGREGTQEGIGLVADLIGESKTIVSDASKYFDRSRETDETHYELLAEGIEKFTALEQKILSLRENSLEMELVAVNAMTVAVRAGKSGRGLSYLTDQLKRLSLETFDYTEELTARGQELIELLRDFQRTLGAIKLFQRTFCENFRVQLDKSFSQYNDAVQKMAELLFEFVDATSVAKHPLAKISEAFDVFESMEREIDEYITGLETADNELPPSEETGRLLHVIADGIDDGNSDIDITFESFAAGLRQLRADMHGFTEFLLGNPSDQDTFSALTLAFDDCAGAMRILIAQIEDSMIMKGRIAEESGQIIADLRALDTDFSNFLETIDTFYSIDVILRIEIAKQEALKDKREIIGEMTDITSQIRDNLTLALRAVKEVSYSARTTVHYFSQKLDAEEKIVGDIQTRIKENYDKLSVSNDYFADSIRGLTVYSDGLVSQLDEYQTTIQHFHAVGFAIREIAQGLAPVPPESIFQRPTVDAASTETDDQPDTTPVEEPLQESSEVPDEQADTVSEERLDEGSDAQPEAVSEDHDESPIETLEEVSDDEPDEPFIETLEEVTDLEEVADDETE